MGFFVFPMSDERFEVVVHHRGEFAKNEWCKYVGGETTHWSCDPDHWSYFEILGSLKEMGYHSVKGLCYCVEMLLHPLNDDRGALNMLHIARHYGEVHMFVVHGVDEAQVDDNIVEPEGDDGRPVESGENSHAVSEFEVLGTEIVVWSAPPEDVTSAPVDDARNEDTEIGSDEGEVVDSLRRCGEEEVGVKNVGTGEEEVGGENVGTGEEEAGVENLGTDEAEVGGENLGTGEAEVGGENLGTVEAEVGVDKGLDNERDCDDERVEVDSWIDSDADCIGDSDGDEWGCGNGGTEGVVDVEIDVDYGQGEVGPSSQNHDSEDSASQSENDGRSRDRGLSDNSWESEELCSIEGSGSETEHDGMSGYFGTFKKPKSMADYKWEVGTTFVDKEQFVDGVRTYAVHAGRNLKFDKNDKERVRVRCLGAQGKCDWSLYCGFLVSCQTWQLRKVQNRHKCSREFSINLMNSKWLSKTLDNTLIENPNLKLVDIRNKAARKWNTKVSVSMAHRAKQLAAKVVEGSFKD